MKKLAFVLLFTAIIVFASGCENPNVNVNTEKTLTLNDVTVHYSGDVSLSQAKAVIGFVEGTFQINGKTDVYLSKSGDTYTVKVTAPYKSSDEIDAPTKFYLKMMASKMSQDVFNGAPAVLELITGEKSVIFSARSRYSYVKEGSVTVWYSRVSEGDARKVLDYAVSVTGSGPWDIIVEKNAGTYDVKPLSSFQSADEIGDAKGTYQEMTSDLSSRLGGKVILHVLSPSGEEIAVFGG